MAFKRYLVFAGYSYYPEGGMGDFVESFDDMGKAIDRANKEAEDYDCWGHVWDSEEMKEVVSI